jgi:hypothetical protein
VKPPKPKTEAASQADKFRDLARELECDESEDAFKAVLKKVATAPRQPAPEDARPKAEPGKRRPYRKRPA